MVLAAITLVPALCGLAGRRLLSRQVRRATPDIAVAESGTQRFATRIARRPVTAVLVSLVILAGLAASVLGMRTWPQDAGTEPTRNTTRRAYDLVAEDMY